VFFVISFATFNIHDLCLYITITYLFTTHYSDIYNVLLARTFAACSNKLYCIVL